MRNLTKSFSPASIAALVLLVLIAIFDFVVPKPSATKQGKQLPVSQIVQESQELSKDLDKTKSNLIAKTWVGPEDEVAPKAMALVSQFAKKNFVSVSAFRPQRTVSVDGVRQLNYLLAAEGPYPEIVKFLQSFESKDSKIAVKNVQMSSADGATDLIRASITLVAYQVEEKVGK